MLARLGHHSFISRNDKRQNIDAVGAGKHVLYEPLVARYINKAEAHIAKIEIGKAQINGNSAPLLFGQTVGIFAGQSADQRTLAVIDVSCCADDYRSHLGNGGMVYIKIDASLPAADLIIEV